MTMPQETTTATVGEDRRPSWHSSLGTREGGCAEFSVRPMSNHRFSSRSWPCAARRSMDYFRALRPPVSFAPQCRCFPLSTSTRAILWRSQAAVPVIVDRSVEE